jgi:uncharacterized protein YacL
MGMIILNSFLIVICALSGFYIGFDIFRSTPYAIVGALVCLVVSLLVIVFEKYVRKSPPRVILGGVIGLLLSLIIANFFIKAVFFNYITYKNSFFIYLPIVSIICYLGIVVGVAKGGDFDFRDWKKAAAGGVPGGEQNKIIDTSTIIDGRIADICETGFIEGIFIIPQFVLQELQHIADSTDPIKRTRGRRGLDILKRIQKKTLEIQVEITDQDFPRIKEVDSKLIALAQKVGGKIITNDFNLNKVAELQGVKVLNINDLANSLKPVVLPGEQMAIRVLKEGREPRQGVAYLDDGTMIVVDDARSLIGKKVEVVVTSVLQTTAGRMIFAKLKEHARGNGEYFYPNGKSPSNGFVK